MATNDTNAQYSNIYTLAINAGIKRDGTIFETAEFTDGVWCRFQRERAKKIGGYRTLFNSFTGIYRGMVAQPSNGVNYVFAGNANGIDVFTTDINFGQGIGPFTATVAKGTTFYPVVSNTTTSFAVAGDKTAVFPAGTKLVFTQSGTQTVYTVSTSSFSTPNTTVNFSPALGAGVTITQAWLANTAVFTPDPVGGPYRLSWQFDIQYSSVGAQLSVLAHGGYNLQNIDNGVVSQVMVGNVNPSTGNTWTFVGLSDSLGTAPTYQPISVDGGVCALHPFIFVYGSHGYIANNNVSSTYSQQNFYDWNGTFANQVNMSGSKIVKGLPMRGGTASPSGLFWATDSLIRVSFNAANAPQYWSYDTVSSQISIMSSNAVVEMDGSYFWMGVDRFYFYNGSVYVLPNDKNVNWLFDNLNYQQRQKVWATKIPRYNEIWFFYPRGTATECTDAIIYNVKDKIWYDAGEAVGAQRSCGYPTEIFPTPLWADWNYSPLYSQAYTVIATPTGQPVAGANQFYIVGDVTPTFSPGSYMSFANGMTSQTYLVTASTHVYNTTIGATGATLVTINGTLLSSPAVGTVVYSAQGGYAIWQHEFGVDAVSLNGTEAVYSSITTSDISWIGGTPSGDAMQGVNRRMHITRFEPNFLQAGSIAMTVFGRKFAEGMNEEDSGPYMFDSNTGKIDLRVEHRLVRLQFVSNEIGGNYEMGRNIITAEYGDQRP